MKKSIILLSAITMVLSICSCQKESRFEYGTKGASLTATFEEQVDPSATKTYLDNGLVRWSPEDAIKVFYSEGEAYQFDLVEGENTVNARFEYSGDVSGEPQYAIYPYSADASISGSNITFTIPAVQKYVADSFDNGANVAVAQVTSSGMQFKNVCGVLKISLKGNGLLKKLVLTGNADEKLNGDFTVDASSSTPSATATTTSVVSEKSITLDCPNSVVLLSSTAVSFYFVVPVGAFSTSGFEIKAYSVNDVELNVELVGDNENVINRSRIRAMNEPKTVNGYDLPGYQSLEYIEVAQTGQYLQTDVIDCTGMDFDVVYLYTRVGTSTGELIFSNRKLECVNYEISNFNGAVNGIVNPSETRNGFVAIGVDKRAIVPQLANSVNHLCSENGHIFLNGTLVNEVALDGTTQPVSDNQIFIFCSPLSSNRDYCTPGTRLYHLYFKKDGSYIGAFVPVIVTAEDGVINADDLNSPKNTVGLYDLVSQQLFVNKGPEAFVAGPAI